MAIDLNKLTVDALRDQAAKNSQKWHTAGSKEEQDALHAENVEINKILDARTGSSSTYDAPSGTWNVTGGSDYAADLERQLARQEGATLGQQALYGVGSAISGAMIEKAFDGLSGLYGESATKAWAKKFASLFKNDRNLQKYAEAAFNDAGEGAIKSVLTDVANELLKTTYNGKSIAENYHETEFDRVKRDMIISTIVSILFGDTAFRK